MDYIKTKPTLYKGQLFTSRLKARWAVYFDALPIKWVYKPRGNFPDFWLPQVNMWAEVRPLGLTPYDYDLAFDLVKNTGYSLLMLIGDKGPKFRGYYALDNYTTGVHVGVSPYAISNYGDYPEEEHRFYFCGGDDNLNDEGGESAFGDIIRAIQIARNIDFDEQAEYEKDKLSKIQKWTYSLREPVNR